MSDPKYPPDEEPWDGDDDTEYEARQLLNSKECSIE